MYGSSQLQIFRTLAEELNFTRTAEKVHTVQSNVTAQIKALEDELGTPLFDRPGPSRHPYGRGPQFLPSRRRPSPPWTRAAPPSRPAPSPRASAHRRSGERSHLSPTPGICTPSAATFPTSNSLQSVHRHGVCARARSRQARHGHHHDGLQAFIEHQVRPPAHEQVFLLADPSHPLPQATVKPFDLVGQIAA